MPQPTSTSRSADATPPRRSPYIGVSGVTLLMLVTLVLTSSPALGRVRDIGAIQATETGLTGREAVSAERTEPRLGGRRETSPRQTRPFGLGLAMAHHRASLTSQDARSRLAAMRREGPTPSERIALLLLNLPPPVVA